MWGRFVVFSRILEALYDKVLINIIHKETQTLFYIEVISKKEVKKSLYKEFDSLSFTSEMKDFVEGYIKQTPYWYVSFLDTSSLQGALPTCSKTEASRYVDLQDCEYKCYEGRWSFYTSRSDIYVLEKNYSEIGVDFVFSPFLVLHNFFKDKVSSYIALYVLVQEETLVLSVFENDTLLYANYMELEKEHESMSLTSEGLDDVDELEDISFDDDSIDLEDIDVDDQIESIEDFGEIEDLGDIEDLDALEDIEQFSDHKDIEEELLESGDKLSEGNGDNFTKDFQRFSLIERAVGDFYEDERYKSQFLENIYIADTIGVSNDLKKYLEEEMFFNVYIRKMDIATELCSLVKEELKI